MDNNRMWQESCDIINHQTTSGPHMHGLLQTRESFVALLAGSKIIFKMEIKLENKMITAALTPGRNISTVD